MFEGKRNIQYKGPGVGKCLAHERSSQEIGGAGGGKGVAGVTEDKEVGSRELQCPHL